MILKITQFLQLNYAYFINYLQYILHLSCNINDCLLDHIVVGFQLQRIIGITRIYTFFSARLW